MRYDRLGYDEVIARDLQVMDTAAFALARDSQLPLRVFEMSQPGTLLKMLRGEESGTLVQGRGPHYSRPAPLPQGRESGPCPGSHIPQVMRGERLASGHWKRDEQGVRVEEGRKC